MPVPLESVAMGKCFAAPGDRVRRVLSIEGGKVVYETRGAAGIEGSWPRVATVSIGRFAADVEREVPCGWTPITEEPS